MMPLPGMWWTNKHANDASKRLVSGHFSSQPRPFSWAWPGTLHDPVTLSPPLFLSRNDSFDGVILGPKKGVIEDIFSLSHLFGHYLLMCTHRFLLVTIIIIIACQRCQCRQCTSYMNDQCFFPLFFSAYITSILYFGPIMIRPTSQLNLGWLSREKGNNFQSKKYSVYSVPSIKVLSCPLPLFILLWSSSPSSTVITLTTRIIILNTPSTLSATVS